MKEIDKTTENKGEKCINCGCKIREDLLQKLKENRGKERVVCEFCGVELSKVEKSNSIEERDNEAQLKCIQRQMRIFIYRYIYKTLNSPNFIYKILKKQRDLKKFQIDNLAEGLKDVIIQHPFPKEWIEALSMDKNEFIKYHYFLRKALDERRFYQEQYLPFFRESIPFIFGLIIGKYNLSRIQDAEQLEGIEDLKKTFCIHLDTIQLGSFGYYLTLLICRFIYAQIIHFDFNSVSPESDKAKLIIRDMGAQILKMVLLQNLEKQPYFKTLFKKNKELKEEYNRFQSELNYNHIYIDSFIDYLFLLIDMISGVMKGILPISKLTGIKHEMIANLIRQTKFESDLRFSPLFRDNLTLILSHNILLRLYLLADKNHVELQQVELTETCINELSEDIKQNTINYKEIKQEFLTPIIYMDLKDFNKLYQKLREELQKDKILAECFRLYLIKLITIIVENLDYINLPKSLTLEQAIAPTLNILKAVIVPDLVKRKIIKLPKSHLKKPIKKGREIKDRSSNKSLKKKLDQEPTKDNQIYHVQRIRIPFSYKLSEICQCAKKLYNHAFFLGRMLYRFRNEDNFDLASKFPELAQKLLLFMKEQLEPAEYNELEKKLYHITSLTLSDNLHNKLKLFEKYTPLYNFLKNEIVYKNLSFYYSVFPQQVLRCVDSAWTSYYKLLEKWNSDLNYQMNFKRPNMPQIQKKKKEYMLKIPGEFLNNDRMAKGIIHHFQNSERINTIQKRNGKVLEKPNTYELKLPPIFLSHFKDFPSIRTTISDISKIIEVRIIPKAHYYMFEIVYVKDKPEAIKFETSRALAIDFGVNNLATMVTNFGTIPLIIRGKLLKSHNQYVNKMSKLFQQQYHCETLGMSMIRQRREAFIDYFIHKASHLIIEYCREQNISKIAIGYNTFWKSGVNMSRHNNLNFCSIPHLKLLNLIKYKAEQIGIQVCLVNESHTSKCSALDFEPIKHHNSYLGARGITLKGVEKKGNIVKGTPEYKSYIARGLFRSKDGFIIHSDVNGAFNIGRRAFPELFQREAMLISIQKYISMMEKKNPNNNNYLALLHILKKISSGSNVEGSQDIIFLRRVMMLNPHVIPISIFVNSSYNYNKKRLGEAPKIKNEKSKYDGVLLERFKYSKIQI